MLSDRDPLALCEKCGRPWWLHIEPKMICLDPDEVISVPGERSKEAKASVANRARSMLYPHLDEISKPERGRTPGRPKKVRREGA